MNMSVGGLQKQHENWKAARERLFGKKPKPDFVPAPIAIPSEEVTTPKSAPLWTWAEMNFDWHIRVWQEITRGSSISELVHQNALLRAALKVSHLDDDLIKIERRPIADICADVLEAFPGIECVDIRSHHRTKDIVYPRHLCYYQVVEQRPDLSFPQIGKYFGGRDHTTILYGHRKISEMTADDHRRELAFQRKHCKKRRKYARERIRELEAAAAE